MTSSPGDGRYTFDSPENKDGKPLYHNTDNFLPLGFSTPQHSRNSGPSSHNRNYYSAQPKYMLPRQRGFHNRNRNPQQQQQQHQQQQHHQGGGSNSPGAAEGEDRPPERRHFHNRDWKGQNFHQRPSHHNNRFQQQQRNRFGLGHSQNKSNDGKYNVNDYFHPSMLEDPWLQLVQQNERNKSQEGDSSDAGGGGGSGSDMAED